ncbi:galactosyltransferase-related protein [uncultured Chitinophaga sp.]|uniref:galactosyltransferase-related protein n=1 Tax=uncultured Chitinophaga sp. TaxID=339340 RepID=UPI0025ECEFA4|nr:galactosyltransferase-related protein [uncultured Chitinophaga sp.]
MNSIPLQDLTDVTFVIPLRIDSLERLENVVACTSYLLRFFNTHITILEAAPLPNRFLKYELDSRIKVMFTEDHDPIFHRTKLLNQLSQSVTTSLLAIWDSDVIADPKQITAAVELLRAGKADFVYPYNGVFADTGVAKRAEFIQTGDIALLMQDMVNMWLPYGVLACGGGFLANLTAYRNTGMENENFYGWGPEDGERVKRWKILEQHVLRITGPLFHLTHPRGVNSGDRTVEDHRAGIKEYLRICRMSKTALESEVNSWHLK